MSKWFDRWTGVGAIAVGAAWLTMSICAVAQDSAPVVGSAPLSFGGPRLSLSPPDDSNSLATSNRTDANTIKLGNGVSLSVTSSFSDPSGFAWHDRLLDPPGPSLLNGAGPYPMLPYVGPRFGAISPFAANYQDQLPSNMNGKMSMDIGRGLSLNVLGSVTRLPAGYFGAAGLPYGSFTADTWARFGGGMTMDLGNGASLSFSGSVGSAPRYACGFAFGGC